MMKRALLLLSLPLLAASCGSVSPVPTPPAAAEPTSSELVSLRISAAGNVKTQGLAGDFPAAHFDVRVRDASNQPVAFNGGNYDPTGKGARVLTLNTSNSFQQTLLLPAGEYTFENAVLDDSTGKVLLAYGPASENPGTIRGEGSIVQLKFHAVFDKSVSTLAPAISLPQLFTGRTFNLALNPKTAPVGGLSAVIPTADLGNVTYTLGNPTDGVLNNAGGKVGVNVTARGTASDAVLNVTASFSAWIRNAGTDTASFGPTTLEYAQKIELSALVADLKVPVLTFAPVGNAVRNVSTTLSGTATDDVQLGAVRVYDNGALLASSEPGEAAARIAIAAGGSWTVGWTPQIAGSHTLTAVATDSSGNESRAQQTVEVAGGTAQSTGEFIFSPDTRSVEFDLQNGVPRTFRVVVPAGMSADYLALFNPGDCIQRDSFCLPQGIKRFSTSMVNEKGQGVPLEESIFDVTDVGEIKYDETTVGLTSGEYWVTVKPTADTRVSLYGYTN
ncbi:Ig-like domain-containing protein [Deinococcus aerolatus]|uniref:Ig-like domain-containing protein n=1 Tax=Deinococcus aerolatus TaxID=522487 RepID=UPI0016642F38|nr:Ig-like domain-containing protein [Deinococcus aerolatus]